MDSIVIVGGGITGLFSSILLSEKYKNVHLIEKESEIGGLLRSIDSHSFGKFDYGTHIPASTLVDEVDKILFGNLNPDDYFELNELKTGNFFNGRMYENNQFVYAPYLDEDIYIRGLHELMNCNENVKTDNLKSYTSTFYGETFSEHIFRPLMKKTTGEQLEDLHHNAHSLYGYQRIIPGVPFLTKELKKSEEYNQKLSFNFSSEGVSQNNKFYPKHRNGIGVWTNSLVEQAKQKGVTIHTNSIITSIKYENKKIKSVTLNNKIELPTEYMVWTIAPILLLRSLNIGYKPNKKVKFRKVILNHYVFDKPFNTCNYYIYCNDINYKSYRVTLYSNINDANIQEAPYSCTVETFVEDEKDYIEEIRKELVKMGIVSKSANVIWSKQTNINNGFPVMTNDFMEEMGRQVNLIEQKAKNISLLGKASGNSFFMTNILTEVYKETLKIIDEN